MEKGETFLFWLHPTWHLSSPKIGPVPPAVEAQSFVVVVVNVNQF